MEYKNQFVVKKIYLVNEYIKHTTVIDTNKVEVVK